MTVDSPPGEGAIFHVNLPAYEAAPVEHSQSAHHTNAPAGRKMILIAEDEPQIVRICRMMLESAGYQVLSASSGEEAVKVSRSFTGEIHLLLSDMIMPGMDGRELARTLRAERPAMQVMFMTGYPPDNTPQSELETECILQKPLSRESLLHAIAGAFASSQA